MSKKFLVSLAAAAIFLSVGYACAGSLMTEKWRYKLIVTIDTPEGLKTGTAVREVVGHGGLKILPDQSSRVDILGEAVVVDLGKRGKIFALLKWDSYNEVLDALPSSKGFSYYRSLPVGTKADVLEKDYPMIVRFKDLADPRSVELVKGGVFDPAKQVTVYKDKSEELLGKGVKLKNVTVEITDAPVTWEIEKSLPWLPARKNLRGALGGTPERPSEDPTGLFLTGVELSMGRYW